LIHMVLRDGSMAAAGPSSEFFIGGC
jgi:two-component system CheB/CheR fusion protein